MWKHHFHMDVVIPRHKHALSAWQEIWAAITVMKGGQRWRVITDVKPQRGLIQESQSFLWWKKRWKRVQCSGEVREEKTRPRVQMGLRFWNRSSFSSDLSSVFLPQDFNISLSVTSLHRPETFTASLAWRKACLYYVSFIFGNFELIYSKINVKQRSNSLSLPKNAPEIWIHLYLFI